MKYDNSKNRGEVAKFCGHIIFGIYTKDISEEKSFDMLVERFEEDNEKIDLINENEQEELSI